MKKLLTISIVVLMIALVSAGTYEFIIRDAVINYNEKEITYKISLSQTTEGKVTFLCDNKPMEFIISIPYGRNELIADNFIQVIPYYCSKQVTNVYDWNERKLRESDGIYGFSDSEIKIKKCNLLSLSYNTIKDDCINKFGEKEGI